MLKGILGFVRLDTSFGEASSRTQSTDPNRRETLRIRTPLPGLRGEAKWLRMRPATPWSAKALTREVTVPCLSRKREGPLSAGVNVTGARAPLPKGGERWTPIVRAEVGPFRRYPCQSLAHADTISC